MNNQTSIPVPAQARPIATAQHNHAVRPSARHWRQVRSAADRTSTVQKQGTQNIIYGEPPKRSLPAGFNSELQLGDGSSTNRLAPVPVSAFNGIAAATFLAAGNMHSCVAVDYGRQPALCWG